MVKQHAADKYSKGLNSQTHLVSLLFLQLAAVTALRDISNGLRSATGHLNYLSVSRAPCKSSLSDMNLHRTFELFRDLYYALLDKLEPSIHHHRWYARRLKRKIFIIDASIIPLSLFFFDWARFRIRRGAVKHHAVLDYATRLPCYAVLTDGKTHKVTEAKHVVFPSESILVIARVFVDFA